jgi:hypothetical protein
MFIGIGGYLCDIALFAKYLPQLKEIFVLDQKWIVEAKQR